MGKRDGGKWEGSPRDYWPTIDPRAVEPLVPFVRGSRYAEPCYGMGHLEDLLMDCATCVWRSDIDPQVGSAIKRDAVDLTEEDLKDAECIITNPPFTWATLEPIMRHLSFLKPTWLLLPADVMHNKRMIDFMGRCTDVVSVGRLYWKENKVRGVDNYVWFRFIDKGHQFTRFHSRK